MTHRAIGDMILGDVLVGKVDGNVVYWERVKDDKGLAEGVLGICGLHGEIVLQGSALEPTFTVNDASEQYWGLK